MDEEVMESGYDYFKFDEVLEKSKEYLLKLNSKKRLKIIRKLVKNPNFDDTDIYRLCEYEFQKPTYKPPPFVEPKKPLPVQPEERPCAVEDKEPLKIRFVVSGKEPIKPIREQKKPVHKSEKVGPKRPRESESDCEFGDEEEKGSAKKRANKKKKKEEEEVVVAPDNTSELPVEFKERIENLGGSNAMLVIKKKLFVTDVNPNNTRLSLPWKQINMGFLSEEERTFLATREIGRGVPQIKSRIIGGINGLEHGISLRQWDMNTSKAYNLVTGWNDVVKHQSLCAGMTVELWSFRVEGNLWFALVKL